jgi:replicative DNA helicase
VEATTAPAKGNGSVPPHNVEAEASVLGSILMSEQVLDRILIEVGIKAEDFYRPRHALIYGSMVRLKEKAQPEAIDVVTVCDDLKRTGELEQAGGEAYVHSLPAMVEALGNHAHYARIVKDHSILRSVLNASRDIQERVLSFKGEPRELIEQAEQELFRIGHEGATSELRKIEDVLHDELDKLERLSREGLDVTGTPSGFTDLDNLTGGFQPGNLIVLAARPSMGKSCLVTNICENAAVKYGKPVALFSLEMSEAELAQRFIASQARIRSDEMRKGRVKQDRWPKVIRATEKLARTPLYVDDSSDIGILEIRAKARRLHAREQENGGLGLLVVDYLQLMRPEDSTISRVEQIGRISRGLKILARELDIPVIAVSQLSRAVEARPDKQPLLSDLRESGNIEQDADLVMFIYRDEYYNEDSERQGEADVSIAKHRNGPLGRVTLTFISQYPKFANMAREPTVEMTADHGVGG